MARKRTGADIRAAAFGGFLAWALFGAQVQAQVPTPTPADEVSEEEVTKPPAMQLGVRGGVDYSDNVLHAASDEQESYGGTVGLEVGGNRTSGRLTYSAYGDVEYQSYFESSLEDDVLGRMALATDYDILPEALTLRAAGLFTQSRPDLFRPESSDNREDVFSWAFGPITRLRLGNSMSADLNLRYTASNYSQRDLDNEAVGGEVVVGYNGRRESFLGLGAGYYDVDYDSTTEPSAIDFTRDEAFVRFYASGARTEISADLGYQKADSGNLEDSGPMVRANLTRELTPSLSGYLAYNREFPISDGTTIAGSAPVVPDDDTVLTAGPRLAQFASIGFSFVRPRTQADVRFMRSKEEATLGLVGERHWQEFRGSFTRNFTPNAFVTLYAAQTREDLYDLAPQTVEADENTYGAEFEILFGRKLSVVFYAQHKERDSELITDTYRELTGGIYVRFGRVDQSAIEGGATAPFGH